MKKYEMIMIIVMQKYLMKITKYLTYNHVKRSLKFSFIIYADLESLLEKIRSCQNNPKKSYTEKKAKHTYYYTRLRIAYMLFI